MILYSMLMFIHMYGNVRNIIIKLVSKPTDNHKGSMRRKIRQNIEELDK